MQNKFSVFIFQCSTIRKICILVKVREINIVINSFCKWFFIILTTCNKICFFHFNEILNVFYVSFTFCNFSFCNLFQCLKLYIFLWKVLFRCNNIIWLKMISNSICILYYGNGTCIQDWCHAKPRTKVRIL